MLHLNNLQKGTNQSSNSLTFHSLAQAAQCLRLSKEQTTKQWRSQRISPMTDCQTLLPERWLCGSPEGKSSTTLVENYGLKVSQCLRILRPPHFLYTPIHFSPTAALATYYLTSTRFIACKTLSLGRHPCMLSFFLFPYVSVIPCGWWWNHAWCAWPCCIYHRCCSCYLCLLNILSGRWGEGQYCCSFLIFVFHPIVLWLLVCSGVGAYLYRYLAIRLVASGQVFSLSHGTQVWCL